MTTNRELVWYFFFVGFSVAVLIVGLVLASQPGTTNIIERFIRRDIQPVLRHGTDGEMKVPPLVRQNKDGTLSRVREK